MTILIFEWTIIIQLCTEEVNHHAVKNKIHSDPIHMKTSWMYSHTCTGYDLQPQIQSILLTHTLITEIHSRGSRLQVVNQSKLPNRHGSCAVKMTDLDQTEQKYQHLTAKSFRKQPQFKLDGFMINKDITLLFTSCCYDSFTDVALKQVKNGKGKVHTEIKIIISSLTHPHVTQSCNNVFMEHKTSYQTEWQSQSPFIFILEIKSNQWNDMKASKWLFIIYCFHNPLYLNIFKLL